LGWGELKRFEVDKSDGDRAKGVQVLSGRTWLTPSEKNIALFGAF